MLLVVGQFGSVCQRKKNWQNTAIGSQSSNDDCVFTARRCCSFSSHVHPTPPLLKVQLNRSPPRRTSPFFFLFLGTEPAQVRNKLFETSGNYQVFIIFTTRYFLLKSPLRASGSPSPLVGRAFLINPDRSLI